LLAAAAVQQRPGSNDDALACLGHRHSWARTVDQQQYERGTERGNSRHSSPPLEVWAVVPKCPDPELSGNSGTISAVDRATGSTQLVRAA
jgi:hypothetical protein